MNFLHILHQKMQRDRLSQFLPTMAYDQERRLYFNERDMTAGFLVEIAPVAFAGRQVIDSLTAFLSAKWPRDAIAQFCLYSDPCLDGVLTPFRQLRGHDHALDAARDPDMRKFLQEWAHSYADYLDAKKLEGIDHQEVPVPFRNFRSFCTVKVPCTVKEFATRSQDLQLLLENRETLLGALKTCNIGSSLVQPDVYIRLMYQLWNPNHPLPLALRPHDSLLGMPHSERPYIGWDTSQPIYDQVIAADTSVRQSVKKLRVDGWHVRSKTPAVYPNQISPLDINRLIGDIGRANRRQITTPFLLSLILDLNSQESVINKKSNFVLAQGNMLASLVPKKKKQNEEVLQTTAMMNAGHRFIRGVLVMTLFAKSQDELHSASAAVDALWQQEGFRLQNEAGLTLPLFLASQPMGATTDIITRLQRLRPAPAETFAMLAPLQADPRTNSKPVFTFISRRGQLIGHDLRDSPRDYNAVVVAPTGSGKSFMVNFLVTTTLSVGGSAFIIDIGRSYEKVCRVLDGQYIEFTSDSKICLNVFSLIDLKKWNSEAKADVEEIEMYRGLCESILYQMANPTSLITDTEKSFLSEVFAECYDELAKNGGLFSIDMMVKKLEELQQTFDMSGRGDNIPGHLAKRLYMFSSKGKHGSWFAGEFNIEFSKSLVVLELEELTKSEDLRQVALMLLMSVIEHKIYITPDRSNPTLVIMDEAWALLTGANTAKFLEDGFRRARKYGASYAVITQSIFDMKDKNPAVGNAILGNSSWLFFLAPKETEVERALDEKLLNLDEMGKELMVSTHMSPGQYSEICYFDPYGMLRLNRLHVDKKTMLLFTTHPLEKDFLDALRARGLKPWDAICAAEPYLDALHRGTPYTDLVEGIVS